jgi:hypothetical protein
VSKAVRTSARRALAALFVLFVCAAVPVLMLAWGRVNVSAAAPLERPADAALLPAHATAWDVRLDRDAAAYLMDVFFDELSASVPDFDVPPGGALSPPPGMAVPPKTPAFITVYRPGRRPIMVAGREPDLVDAVRRAAHAVRDQIGDDEPSDVRVRIDVLTAAAPLALEQRVAFLARGFGAPAGLALRHQGRVSFFLPAEIVDYRAHDHDSMAAVLCRQAGVDPQRVARESLDIWRLEGKGFVNAGPDSRFALESDRGLTPIGEPNLARLLRAAGLAADYLVGVQKETGAFLTFWDVSSGLKGGCDSLPEQAGAAGALGSFCEVRPGHEYLSADYSAVSYVMNFAETHKERPEMAFARRQEVCRVVWELEATACTLEAVCRFRHATGRTDVDPWISALSEFIMFMQREDGLCDMQFDPESQARTTPPAAKGVAPQAKAALALLLAYRELGMPQCLLAGNRVLDAVDAQGRAESSYSASEARWLATALRELHRHSDDESIRARVSRIAEARRAAQLLPADAPAADLAGGSLGSFPPAAATTADDLIVFAAACEMAAGDAGANRESALLAAGYLMRLQFLPENSYYLSNPAAGRGGVREQPGSNIVRLPTMDAAVRGLTMLAGLEMRSRGDD